MNTRSKLIADFEASGSTHEEAVKIADYAAALCPDGDAFDPEPVAEDPPREAPPVFDAAIKRFAQLENYRRVLEEDLEVTKRQLAKLQEQLIDQFADLGLQNARIDGLTIYVRMDRYVSKKKEYTTEQLCQVLKDVGLGYMVADGYSASSLKAKVAEYARDGIELPSELAEMINVGERPRLVSNK